MQTAAQMGRQGLSLTDQPDSMILMADLNLWLLVSYLTGIKHLCSIVPLEKWNKNEHSMHLIHQYGQCLRSA